MQSAARPRLLGPADVGGKAALAQVAAFAHDVSAAERGLRGGADRGQLAEKARLTALRPADQEESNWLFVAPSKDPAVLAPYETSLAHQAEIAPSWTTEDYLGEEVTRSWNARVIRLPGCLANERSERKTTNLTKMLLSNCYLWNKSRLL